MQILNQKQPRAQQLNIRLSSRSAVLISLLLLAVALLAFLARSGVLAGAAGPTGLRQYYLSFSTAGSGSQVADNLCSSGYHVASLWEIMDTSNLEYSQSIGTVPGDGGGGPPTGIVGWVRTGYEPSTANTPGEANCSGWTSINSGHFGTTLKLTDDWSSGYAGWEAGTDTCNYVWNVWCIED
ncbi:hypothetical protein ACFLZW_04715 [Chloroflexota bacterium]